MEKIKVLCLSLWYPLTMSRYFEKALRHNPNVELVTTGIYTGSWIPWLGGMTLPEKYAKPPDIPLPFQPNVQRVNYEFVEVQLQGWKPDLVISIDAGLTWADKPQGVMSATVATDPHCISGDTLLATGQGLLYAHEASLSTEEVADKNGMKFCQGVVYKGLVPTRRLTLETGQYLSCTDDHLIETKDGFVEARELRVGDSVLMSRGTYFADEGTDEDYSQGFIIGAFQGDGSFGSSDMIKFTIAKKEKETFGKSIKEHLFNGFGIDCATDTKHYTSDNAKVIQVRRWGLYRFLKSLDLKSGKVPLYVRTRSKKFIGGYIAGLFAADGCSVNGIIQFTSKEESLIRELQNILFYFGVISRIKYNIAGLSCYKPGTKYWNLYVAAGNSHEYLKNLTGEIPGRLIRTDSRRRDTGASYYQYVRIVDIEGAVKNNPASRVGEPVYDVVNSESHTFLANGVSVHNCLDYTHQRRISDKFFNMQKCYSEEKDIYLPYAYSAYDHYPEYNPDTRPIRDENGLLVAYAEPKPWKDLDAMLVGLQYTHVPRVQWIEELRKRGLNIFTENGPIFDEYREIANRARIGLNWSTMNDLNARFFETPAFGLPMVANRVPDAHLFMNEDEDYLAFTTLPEAIDKVLYLKNNPEKAEQIAQNGHKKIQPHTYDARVEQILKECGFGE